MGDKNLDRAIEYLKLQLALSFLPYGNEDKEMLKFFESLILNGCPFDALIKALAETFGEKEDKEEDE